MLKYRGLANPALAVDYQDVVDETSTQVLLNPIEYVLPAKEHAWFYDRGSRDVWIEKIVHRSIWSPPAYNLSAMSVGNIIHREFCKEKTESQKLFERGNRQLNCHHCMFREW